MQANTRFVENVQHAYQSRADLRGQANTLRLATAERAAGAIKCQVAQPHIPQKTEPRGDFTHHVSGDFFTKLVQLQCLEKLQRLVDGQLTNIHNR